MKKVLSSKLSVLFLALAVAISFTACGGAPADNSKGGSESNQNTGSLKGTIKVSGSTALQPLLQELSDAFKAVEPGIEVDIQGGDSAQGIADVNAGASDMGACSRDLTDEEKNSGLSENVIAYDGIAVVSNPGIAVASLSIEQLTKIFKGEIKNWKEVGGPDKEILVVSREEGSGIRDDFEKSIKLQEIKDGKKLSLARTDVLPADGEGAVKAIISTKDNAIGYISLGAADASLKKINVEGVECTAASVKDMSYPMSEPFAMITKGDLKPELKAFLEYILSEDGQKIVENKYIKVK